MKPARLARPLAGLLLAAAAGSQAPQALGASVFDFDVWMRAIDQDSVAVQKNLQRGDFSAAQANARRIQDLYARMQAYFELDGHAQDAVDISRDGKEQAEAILASVEARNVAEATASALRIARACNDCHDNYKPFR